MVPELPDQATITGLLRGVVDPELGSNIVELGMVKGVTVADDGVVRLAIALTTAGCPLRGQIQRDAKTRVESLPGVEKVLIDWSELDAEERSAAMAVARKNAAERAPQTAIPATARVLAIASGKGGVGKSSVAANLAAALASRGFQVGVIDADIWGFSIPRMLGLDGRLGASKSGERTSIVPLTRPVGAGRLDVVSMGLLVDDEDSALLWRGLMLNRAVQHFLEDVDWASDLDYVVIDMPPGTGDVAMGLARMIPRAEMIVVTTPATGAQKVAGRAVSMARKSYLRVAGVIENMSYFETPDGERHELFGSGGGEALAAETGLELIGRIPIEPAVSAGGDDGEPVVLGDGTAAAAFHAIADRIVTEVAPPVEMEGCTARMLDLMETALAESET
ncbi:MAG: Mrp/NBP35 family ATP-binding protein [Acidimicrobiia bacterium]|nr:Mrp/NBP35 family ATP-binding protein [Acidimicrobiia bacterium]